MVLFTFTFLLATPYVPTPQVVKKQGTKNKGKENVAVAAEEEKNYKEFEVSKPTLTCRIEYDLYPNNLKYFDVICWGDAATVVTDEHSASLQVHVRDEISWIHFRIKHEIDIDIPTFCGREIKFTVVTNRKQAQAKGRILYGLKNQNYLFVPLLEDLEKLEGDGMIKVVAETGAHFKFVKDAILNASDETIQTLKRSGTDFSISGQTFLAGLNDVKTGIRNHSPELPFILTIATVEKLITKEQMDQYNFISIIINKLNGLPCQDLQFVGISQIKLRYVICGETVETEVINISDKIIINHTKTILIANLDFWTLIEFLQTKGLRIEIIGISPEEQPLGTAVIDLSPLLYSPYRLRTKSDFQPSDVNEIIKNEKFQPRYNVNEINSSTQDRRLIPLTTSPATLKVTSRLFKGIKIPPKPADSLNRIFIVLRDMTTAIHILNIIFPNFSELPDHLLSGTRIKRPGCSSRQPVDYPDTGFLIDCIDKILICIESTSFERIWESVLMIDTAKGQILYDSSLIFLNRLYKDFNRYGGFYTITLCQPLEVLMSKQKTYIKGSLPFPARKALISIQRLIHCSSMKTACRDNLFPTPKSLYSLNIEFGVPLTSQNKLDN